MTIMECRVSRTETESPGKPSSTGVSVRSKLASFTGEGAVPGRLCAEELEGDKVLEDGVIARCGTRV